MNNISFGSKLIIFDLNANSNTSDKYASLSKMFEEETTDRKDTVKFHKVGKNGYDKFIVRDNKNNLEDVMLIKGLENIDKIPVKSLLNKFLDIYNVSKIRLNYEKLLKEQDEKINKLLKVKYKIRQAKTNSSRITMPSDIEFKEFYTII